jgi:hypothetical protein
MSDTLCKTRQHSRGASGALLMKKPVVIFGATGLFFVMRWMGDGAFESYLDSSKSLVTFASSNGPASAETRVRPPAFFPSRFCSRR